MAGGEEGPGRDLGNRNGAMANGLFGNRAISINTTVRICKASLHVQVQANEKKGEASHSEALIPPVAGSLL